MLRSYLYKKSKSKTMVLSICLILTILTSSNVMSVVEVIGDVVLDYDSYTVSGHGEVFELPQKEFLLLYKLLAFPNKIFTRIQLMDEIWGLDCDTGAETVTVHVGRLRKRFENWKEFSIESIRGLGYKAVRNV